MINWQPFESYERYPDIASQTLAELLSESSLSLVLGAGASKGMGMPVWWKLVQSCLKHAGISRSVDENTPADVLMRVVDDIIDESVNYDEYLSNVTDSLYQNRKDRIHLMDQKLLVAIGALAMNSARGSAGEILTFNFDDVIESYLSFHGFTFQSVSKLPCLRRSADVTIFHPHGFLPNTEDKRTRSDKIIFSKFSFDDSLGDQIEPWKALTRDFLLRKVGIFLGVSTAGPNIGPLMTNVSKLLGSEERPVGFWFLANKGKNGDTVKELRRWKIVPLEFESHDDYPEFLLGVCEKAAAIRGM